MQTQTELLRTASQTLLTPYDLEAPQLSQVFGAIMTHDVDYADLYFQYLRTEGWSLEEGIVKSGSFNIDQGVGVRAIAGEKTAFAYSDDISLAALERAADATRAIARIGGKSTLPVDPGRRRAQALSGDRSARLPRRHAEGRAASSASSALPRPRSADRPGHGDARRRIRGDPGRARRRRDWPPTCGRSYGFRCR